MQLTNESCLLSLIFIERLIVSTFKMDYVHEIIIFIEIRRCVNLIFQLETHNFRINGTVSQILGRYSVCILSISLLIPPFFSYWNIDFVEPLGVYPLKSINQIEATFLGLC